MTLGSGTASLGRRCGTGCGSRFLVTERPVPREAIAPGKSEDAATPDTAPPRSSSLTRYSVASSFVAIPARIASPVFHFARFARTITGDVRFRAWEATRISFLRHRPHGVFVSLSSSLRLIHLHHGDFDRPDHNFPLEMNPRTAAVLCPIPGSRQVQRRQPAREGRFRGGRFESDTVAPVYTATTAYSCFLYDRRPRSFGGRFNPAMRLR